MLLAFSILMVNLLEIRGIKYAGIIGWMSFDVFLSSFWRNLDEIGSAWIFSVSICAFIRIIFDLRGLCKIIGTFFALLLYFWPSMHYWTLNYDLKEYYFNYKNFAS